MRKKIVFAGLGAQFNYSQKSLSRILRCEPDIYLDNDPKKINSKFQGRSIVSSKQLPSDCYYEIYIFTRDFENIYDELISRNVQCICYYVLIEKNQFAITGLPNIKDICNYKKNSADFTLNLKGKKALVTGASKGVGKKIATELADLGCDLIIQGRDQNLLNEVAFECRKSGNIVEVYNVDLTIEADLRLFLNKIGKNSIDILYNNAAISLANVNTQFEINYNNFLNTLSVNTIAPAIISLFFYEGMRMKGEGWIVNLTTNLNNNLWSIDYACSKAAIDKLTSELSIACEGTEICVSSFDPGSVRTAMSNWSGTHDVDALVPGLLLGVSAPCINGKNIVATDYKGLNISQAIEKYKTIYSL
jgi:short-subunit dehydrogenase